MVVERVVRCDDDDDDDYGATAFLVSCGSYAQVIRRSGKKSGRQGGERSEASEGDCGSTGLLLLLLPCCAAD